MPPRITSPKVVSISFRVGGTQNQAASPSFRGPSYLPGKRTNTERARTRLAELTGKINIQVPDYASRIGDIRRPGTCEMISQKQKKFTCHENRA
jgi:hypothetical protein